MSAGTSMSSAGSPATPSSCTLVSAVGSGREGVAPQAMATEATAGASTSSLHMP